MQFNPGDGSGIVDEIDAICDSDSVAYPIAAKVRRSNTALETLVTIIITADGTWQFDDSNNTDLPNGTGNLIEGQSSYSFAQQFLDIQTVKVLDAGGQFHIIKPWDQSQSKVPFEVYYNQKGFPMFYDKISDTIKFGPAPSATFVTLTAGLKVEFQRTAVLFTVSDTTKQPGIASPFHITVAKMAALPYCKTYKKDRVPQLVADIAEDVKNMKAFYSSREKDTRKQIGMKPIRFR